MDSKIHAVIFDMDGVLVDSEQLINRAAIAMFKERGLTVQPADFLPFVGTGEERYVGGVAETFVGDFLDPLAVLDHPCHAFQHPHVRQRIALDRDHVRKHPRPQRPDLSLVPDQRRRLDRRRADRLQRRHPIPDHVGELPRVEAVRIDPRIGAEPDPHDWPRARGRPRRA